MPFINLFYEVLGKIAPKYFAGGESVLHNACLDISNWPPLQGGECIQLPMLGILFQTYIPSLTSANLQQSFAASIPPSTAASNQIEDLTNVSSNETFTPSLTSEADRHAKIALGSSNDTSSERSEDYEDACVKNDNISQLDNTQSPTAPLDSGISGSGGGAGGNGDIVQSREDILDRFKQSKEQLLAQKLKPKSDLPCDKNSSKSLTGANNANEYEIDDNNDGGNGGGGGGGGGDDDGDSDLDNYLNGSYSDSCTNTQSDTSTNIERPLQIAQQSPAKTPIVLLSATEIDIFRSLYTVLSYTHLLWELVITAEPIVVMATSPSDSSHMVQSLMRLVAFLNHQFRNLFSNKSHFALNVKHDCTVAICSRSSTVLHNT